MKIQIIETLSLYNAQVKLKAVSETHDYYSVPSYLLGHVPVVHQSRCLLSDAAAVGGAKASPHRHGATGGHGICRQEIEH